MKILKGLIVGLLYIAFSAFFTCLALNYNEVVGYGVLIMTGMLGIFALSYWLAEDL